MKLLHCTVMLVALAACQTNPVPTPKTYRQAVLEAAITYSTVAHAAVSYGSQPRCSEKTLPPPLCSEADVVVKLYQASLAARAALAIAVALDGKAEPSAQEKALEGLQATVNEFADMTKPLGGK
jgi:hypothetical protein